MQTAKNTFAYALALCTALLAASTSTQGAIISDFDDLVYPGTSGDGWVDGWQNTTIGTPEILPEILTNNPIDGSSPYLHFDATGGTIRNLMRQYETGAGVNVGVPHYIRWKFRLAEADFDTYFTSFNDRIHFFSRTAPRLTGSTDASMGWGILAAGAAHSTGAAAGKTFWIYDNVDETGAFTLENHVDTGVALVTNHVYAFEVYVIPDQQSYTVSILDETSSASFTSSAPHKFRNLGSPGNTFTYIHFGTQASSGSDVRPFDLDSFSITPWAGPVVEDMVPSPFAVHWATNGLHFEVNAEAGIDTNGISLVLNSNDVSSQLVITGDPTNRQVSFDGLMPNLKYKMELTVSNAVGSVSLASFFYTPESSPVTLFDSGGFADDTLYPVGYLTAVTNDDSRWAPALDPNSGEIVDLADGQYGKVLRRQQLGADYIDYLLFPPVSSGVVEIELDAEVSSMAGRTIDLSLNSVSANGGGTQGPFIMWGTNALNYYDRTAWVPQTNLDAGWHHVKLTCYVSGPLGGTFDLEVDSTPVSQGLVWRNVFSPVATLRIGAIRGDVIQYGEVDNLVVRVAPEPLVAVPATLLDPVHDGSSFSFSFLSQDGINYTAFYNGDLGSTNWTTLESIAGDGTMKTVTHTNAPAGPLYYKVRSELP